MLIDYVTKKCIIQPVAIIYKDNLIFVPMSSYSCVFMCNGCRIWLSAMQFNL